MSNFLNEDRFERNFRRGFKAIVVLQILFVITIVVVIVAAITHPQAIGEFFGNIVSGFKAVAK